MIGASTHPVAPTPKINAPNPPGSSAPIVVAAPGRLRLDEASANLVAATAALDGWYARETSERHSYVGAGHEVIRLIDTATRELYRVRAALVREICADDEERAVRVDRMIAEFKARRQGDRASDPAPPDGGAA